MPSSPERRKELYTQRKVDSGVKGVGGVRVSDVQNGVNGVKGVGDYVTHDELKDLVGKLKQIIRGQNVKIADLTASINDLDATVHTLERQLQMAEALM